MRFLRLLFLAVLCAVVLLTPRAHAALCGEEQQPCNPNKMGSACYKPKKPCPKCKPKKCNKCTKSPGYVGIGAYEIDTTDLTIPTAGAFPLLAMRRYDSTHQFDGALGYGWVSSFEPRLFHAAYLFAAPSTYRHEVDVVLPDTEHFTFSDPNGSGTFTAEPGRYDKLVKNADGTWDLTLEHSRSVLHFDAQGLLTSMKDDFGNEQLWTYDVAGRLQRVADNAGSGRYLDIVWGADGRISHVIDHTSRQVEFTYNTDGVLTEVTNPLGQVTEYDYVPGRFAPLLSQIRDNWDRVITDVTWDAQDRVTGYTENGESYTYSYGSGSVTTKTDGSGNAWSYPYDGDGLVTEDRLPGGAKRYATFDGNGNVVLLIDEVGVKTRYTHDSAGHVTTMTANYQGTTPILWDYTYDPNFPDLVTSMLPKTTTGANHPDWQGTVYEYYQAGSAAPGALYRVTKVRNDGVTADVIATYTYDAKGHLTSATNAHGGVTDYAYDTAGNLTLTTLPLKDGVRAAIGYGYDALGRMTSFTDPYGKVTTYTYDALDRGVTMTLPKPVTGSPLVFTTKYAYDNYDVTTGLVFLHRTDPSGRVTKEGRDAFGRTRKIIDAAGNASLIAYSGSHLSSVTDANGNVTAYEYDANKRLTASVFANGSRESYTYYADGLPKTRTDRKNQVVTFSYDAHKNLTKKLYPNGTYVEYTYTGQKLVQVYDTSTPTVETHTFTYDSSFRVDSNTQGSRGTISYTYTPADAVATRSISGGSTASYTYHPDGTVDTIAWSPVAGQFDHQYRLDKRYGTVVAPNGQTRIYSYDDQGRLTQLANSHPTAGTLASFGYGYDLDHATGTYTRLGQRVTMTADVPALGLTSALTKYTYDANEQLTNVDYPGPAPFNGDVHSWAYDAIGNRIATTVNGVTTTQTYQKIGTNPYNWTRLASDAGGTWTYDANGNLATRGAYTYSWDTEDRLTDISGGAAATYTYDYLGRRSSKTVGGVTTTYLYEDVDVIAESGPATTEYLIGPEVDEVLAMFRNGAVSYYCPDGLGSIAVVNDASGTVQNSYAYDAWGVPESVSETVPQPARFTGREVGDVPNEWFYRSRFYVAGSARFASEDPLSYAGGRMMFSAVHDLQPLTPDAEQDAGLLALRASHPFIYVSNGPAENVDPLGAGKFNVMCWYYVWKCNKDSQACVKKWKCWDKMDDDELAGQDSGFESSAKYKKCFQGQKSCKKMKKKCGPDYVTAPGLPPVGGLAD